VNFRKPITEADLLAFLREGHLQFPPLQVAEVLTEASRAADNRLDAILTLGWQDRTHRFGIEVRRLWTPKSVSEAADTIRRHISLGEGGLLAGVARELLYPLILVPYLSEERLLWLQTEGVSGIDLCGNGIVIVPNELLVLRTGFPNQFRWEGTIRNVYRKNSSIVARVFLLVPQFNSVKAVLEQTRQRGGAVTLGTVSKVCKSLGDDLIIERFRPKPEPGALVSQLGPPPALRLLQPDKLLDLLASNYAPPAVSRTFRGKWGLRPEDLRARLAGWEEEQGMRVALTGESSVEAYAVMARGPMQSFYCSDIDKAIASLGEDVQETDRFANVTLLETQDEFVYFDRRRGLVASPIQSYLELVYGDTRERQTAGQVRQVILGPLVSGSRKG
jgi:hypothetical protein